MLLSRFRKIWDFSRINKKNLSAKIAACCLGLLLLLTARPAQALEGELLSSNLPLAGAGAAAVIEAHTGQVLFSVEGEAALPPASCGKILTALTVLDMVDDLSAIVTVSAAAAAVGESSIYLREGEEISFEDLLLGALVHSGNDACYALAEGAAGSEDFFVHWLNMKAALLGAYSCNFTNTNGLPDEEHVISAVDLSLLTAKAMENEFFAATVSSKYVSFSGSDIYRSYKNTNKLLWQDEHVVGVKTGTTNAAGPCLVTAYQDGAALFISTVFDSNDRYGESMRLLKWAAANYVLACPVTAGQLLAYSEQHGLLMAAEDVCFLLEQNAIEQVRVLWQLPNCVQFVSAEGKLLAECALLPAGD